jgi:hypothetical protein
MMESEEKEMGPSPMDAPAPQKSPPHDPAETRWTRKG